jgi:hypothetical protein
MASKRHIRRRSCTAKTRYPTEEIAKRAAAYAQRRCTTGVSIGTYKCSLGNHWHLCRRNGLFELLPRAAKLGANRRSEHGR